MMKAVGYINGSSVIGTVNETGNGFMADGHVYEIVESDGTVLKVRAWSDKEKDMDHFYISLVPEGIVSRLRDKNISGEDLYYNYMQGSNDIIAIWCVEAMVINGWDAKDIYDFSTKALYLLEDSRDETLDWESKILDMLVSEGGYSDVVRLLLNNCKWKM